MAKKRKGDCCGKSKCRSCIPGVPGAPDVPCATCGLPDGVQTTKSMGVGFNGTIFPLIEVPSQIVNNATAQLTQGPTSTSVLTTATSLAGEYSEADAFLQSISSEVVNLTDDTYFCYCLTFDVTQLVQTGWFWNFQLANPYTNNNVNLTFDPNGFQLNGSSQSESHFTPFFVLGPVAVETNVITVCGVRTGNTGVIMVNRVGSVSGAFASSITFNTRYPEGPMTLAIQQVTFSTVNAPTPPDKLEVAYQDFCIQAGV
jgi:hypothetical protein